MDDLSDPASIRLARDLTRLGRDSRDLSRGALRGQFVRLRRGVYLPSATWAESEQRALLRMRAVALSARRSPLFSHRSAATAWGIPFLTAGAPLAETLVAPARGGRSGRGIVRRCVDLDAVSIATVDGFRVTSVERTLIDLALTTSFASAVIALDFCLSTGDGTRAPLTTLELVRSELDGLGIRRGLSRVLRTIDFADGRSESPNESLSRVRFLELGFPAPELQVEFMHHTGITDRVDFFWRDFGHIGETDGLVKYTDPRLRGGRSAEQVVVAEKLREDRLRSQQPRFSRWTWRDAYAPERLRAILLAAGLPSRGR